MSGQRDMLHLLLREVSTSGEAWVVPIRAGVVPAIVSVILLGMITGGFTLAMFRLFADDTWGQDIGTSVMCGVVVMIVELIARRRRRRSSRLDA